MCVCVCVVSYHFYVLASAPHVTSCTPSARVSGAHPIQWRSSASRRPWPDSAVTETDDEQRSSAARTRWTTGGDKKT